MKMFTTGPDNSSQTPDDTYTLAPRPLSVAHRRHTIFRSFESFCCLRCMIAINNFKNAVKLLACQMASRKDKVPYIPKPEAVIL